MSTTIRIETIIDYARRACEGMTDVANVEPSEDAATAAREIVAYWEGETGLLTSGTDAERWAEMGATEADMDELRGRCIADIEAAIVAMRAENTVLADENATSAAALDASDTEANARDRASRNAPTM